MLRIYYIYYSYLYVHNENNEGVTIIVRIIMYDDDNNWRAMCYHYKIRVVVGGYDGYYLIVIWLVLTLYDLYAVVVKDRV